LAVADLDEEWQRPAKAQRYRRPSARLLNTRVMLKGMIKAKRFEDVEPLGKIIDQLQTSESAAATAKMQADYEVADQRLNEVYRIEKIAIEGKQEVKMSDMIRTRDRELAPLYTRIETLKRKKEVALAYQKKIVGWDLVRKGSKAPAKAAVAPMPANLTVPIVPSFVRNPRLSVPTFAPKKRNAQSRPATASLVKPQTKPVVSS
jgi:hypothetical protein